MFEVEKFDASKNEYTFGKGGNQGARGNNNGGDFFIQDVRMDTNEYHVSMRTSGFIIFLSPLSCMCTHDLIPDYARLS